MVIMSYKFLIIQRELSSERGQEMIQRTRGYFMEAARELGNIDLTFSDHSNVVIDRPNRVSYYDAIYMRSIGPYPMKAGHIGYDARSYNVPLIDRYISINAAPFRAVRPHTKMQMYEAFLDANVNTPPTVRTTTLAIRDNDYNLDFLRGRLSAVGIKGTGFTVLKVSRGGRQGIGTYGIRKPEHIRRAVDDIIDRFPAEGEHGREVLLQRNIKNDGDIRLIVVGGEVIGGFKRGRKKRYMMMTASKKSRPITGSVPEDIEEQAVRACNALGIDIASVDMVRERKTGTPYVIEVNSAPSFHVYNRYHPNAALAILEYMKDIAEQGEQFYING